MSFRVVIYLAPCISFLQPSLLIRQQLGERLLTSGNAVGQNHLTHSNDLLILEEHVLGTCSKIKEWAVAQILEISTPSPKWLE